MTQFDPELLREVIEYQRKLQKRMNKAQLELLKIKARVESKHPNFFQVWGEWKEQQRRIEEMSRDILSEFQS
jgi:hypothetical protein